MKLYQKLHRVVNISAQNWRAILFDYNLFPYLSRLQDSRLLSCSPMTFSSKADGNLAISMLAFMHSCCWVHYDATVLLVEAA